MGILSTANSNSVFSMSATLAKVFQNLGSLLYLCFWGYPNLAFPSIMLNSHTTPVIMLIFEVYISSPKMSTMKKD